MSDPAARVRADLAELERALHFERGEHALYEMRYLMALKLRSEVETMLADARRIATYTALRLGAAPTKGDGT